MGDTLHKMQVIIEATTEPLKKGMENSLGRTCQKS